MIYYGFDVIMIIGTLSTRLILMVSGAFWGTCIPAFIIQLVLYNVIMTHYCLLPMMQYACSFYDLLFYFNR